MNYSLFKWSRKTCSGHDSNAAILQASREYGVSYLVMFFLLPLNPPTTNGQARFNEQSHKYILSGIGQI